MKIATKSSKNQNELPVISCQNIVKKYGNLTTEVTILDKISFNIYTGEFVAIVGPSGSGKTTLMNILGALDSPTSGTYTLDGKPVSNLKDDDLAIIRNTKIGFVFQSYNLLPRATVERNIRLPLLYSSVLSPLERKKRIENVLESAGLSSKYFQNKTNQLSGGQMQRVAIARALVNNPSIILADEPTGNLDQLTGKIVINSFLKLNQEGRTIVLITHDLNVANNASRIIHIQDGKIIADEFNKNQPKGL